MPFDLAKSLASVPEDQRPSVVQRLELVYAAQRRLGMEPRNDSQLTWKYAVGELEEDDVPSAIASELVIVDALYKNTEYGTIVEDTMREVADHIKKKYRLSWTDAWEITRFYVPSMLKLYCAKRIPSSSEA